MTERELLEPILEEGLQASNFFNGRLLTAEALQTEQGAYRARDALIGEAVGEGVVRGLWVSLSSSDDQKRTLRIDGGLGIARSGNPLRLPVRVELALTVAGPQAREGAGVFADCETVISGTTKVGSGFHLLTLCPADGFKGSAPIAGDGTASGAGGCGKRHVVEGVRFRLIYLNPDLFGETSADIVGLLESDDPAGRSRLRNRVAHACFGTGELERLGGNLYHRAEGGLALDDIGAIGALRRGDKLAAGELPLALVHWKGNHVDMVDNWSVRRTALAGRRHTGWPVAFRSRQEALREAVLLQFQEHVADLASDPRRRPDEAALSEMFVHLPPVGAVPVGGEGGLPAEHLWKGLDTGPEIALPPGRWLDLLDLATTHAPVRYPPGERFSIYRDQFNDSSPGNGQNFVWFARESVACRFCAPMLIPREDGAITAGSLRDLFATTADGQAAVQNYALARSRDAEREAAAFMALHVGAGQVSSLARVLAVLAGHSCCYAPDAAMEAFAGLWDAQSDMLLRIDVLPRWMGSSTPDEDNENGGGGGATIGGGVLERIAGGQRLERRLARDLRLNNLEEILRPGRILDIGSNAGLWGPMAPETLGQVLTRLGADLTDMKGFLDSAELLALIDLQEAINERWASFLETQGNGG